MCTSTSGTKHHTIPHIQLYGAIVSTQFMAMRLKRPASLLQQSVKHIGLGKTVHQHISRRYVSAAPPQNIAILGSGITGLTTAYYLSQAPNAPKITIYESSPRVGGWLNSKYVDVPGGQVLFEQGPRSLRPGIPRGAHAAALVGLTTAGAHFV
jgi:hypothetical protein